jgi:hypothetical protein
MNTSVPTNEQAMSPIMSLEDLAYVAAQRDLWNAVYPLAAQKIRRDHSVQAIADAYGIHRTTAHVLIRDAA